MLSLREVWSSLLAVSSQSRCSTVQKNISQTSGFFGGNGGKVEREKVLTGHIVFSEPQGTALLTDHVGFRFP